MYTELVTECAKDNQWTQIQPGASEKEIELAEWTVGYTFPEELRKLLLEMNGDRYLLFSIGEIIEDIKTKREYLLECYEDVDKHIFFAGNGCGDHYCYNIGSSGKADDSVIYIWEHETNKTFPVVKNIPELIRRYYNSEI